MDHSRRGSGDLFTRDRVRSAKRSDRRSPQSRCESFIALDLWLFDRLERVQDQIELTVAAGEVIEMTVVLIKQSLYVWHRYYDHPLTAKEAREIVLSTGRMVEILKDGDPKSSAKASKQAQPFDSWLES